MIHPELESALRSSHRLSSPPMIALQVIDLAQQANTGIAEIAAVASRDPALTQRLLQAANSPIYGRGRKAETLHQAAALLGLNATLTLTLGFSLINDLQGTAGEQKTLWHGSVLAALAARTLGAHARVGRSEELLLAGLLQDIGAMALLKALPERYLDLRQRSANHAEMLALERQELGNDHAEVGAWLADRWNLPQYLRDAIGASHSEPTDRFQACVVASSAIARLWLGDDSEALRADARARVDAIPGKDPSTLADILAELSDSLVQINELFGTQLWQPQHLMALSEEAQDLLALRHLDAIQNADLARREAEQSAAEARTLAEESRRDPLTGIYNRRQMEEMLDLEFATSRALGQSLSIAFIDIDHFKRINDEHGHLVGDQVLRNFAGTLQAKLRTSDTVARYGGEEFLVMLGQCGEAPALATLQRILDGIAALPMAMGKAGPIHVSFSAGIATFDAQATDFENIQDLIQAADQALYDAKHAGRHRIHCHRPNGWRLASVSEHGGPPR